MNLASQTLLLTRSIGPSGYRTGNISRLISPPVSRLWAHTPRPVLFATDTSRRRQSSTMASESLDSSESDAREHRQHRNSTEGREGTPYAARAAAGAAAASSFFPLGYREGFSQWVSRPEHAPIGYPANRKPSGLVSLLQLQSTKSFPIFRICISIPQPISRPVTRRTSPTVRRRAV